MRPVLEQGLMGWRWGMGKGEMQAERTGQGDQLVGTLGSVWGTSLFMPDRSILATRGPWVLCFG